MFKANIICYSKQYNIQKLFCELLPFHQVAKMDAAKMDVEQFAHHCVQKMEKMLADRAKKQYSPDLYAEMDMAQDRGEDVYWSQQELKKGASYYTGVTKAGFSDPSKLSFKAWMIEQLHAVKQGQTKAKLNATAHIGQISQKIELNKVEEMPPKIGIMFMAVLIAAAFAPKDHEIFAKMVEIVTIAMAFLMIWLVVKMGHGMA